MTLADFDRIAERVRAAFGIELRSHKQQMIYARLSRRLRALGLTDFRDYLDLLDSPHGRGELEQFTNAVTTNLTAFFREPHHFEHFEAEVLAPFVAGSKRRLAVWSAGCSTGEEPYSIALMVHELMHALAGREVQIAASDLDTRVLAEAAAGRYPLARLAPVPARFRGPRFFRFTDEGVEVAPAVRRRVSFRRDNLVTPSTPPAAFDAIFCRNVLIYFEPEAKLAVIDRLARSLAPGGVLYLGHSESILGRHPLLAGEGRTVYRRRDAGSRSGRPAADDPRGPA